MFVIGLSLALWSDDSFVVPSAVLGTAGRECQPWCHDDCKHITGDVTKECASCSGETYKCRIGMPGFQRRAHKKLVEPPLEEVTSHGATEAQRCEQYANFKSAVAWIDRHIGTCILR